MLALVGALALALLILVLTLAAAVVIPHLARRRLPARADLDGMYLVKDGMVSACVIPLGGGQAALVDAGMHKDGTAILAELARHGIDPGGVTAVLLTHGHWDHTGGVGMFPNAQVMALAAEVDVVEGRSFGGGPLERLAPARPTGIRVTGALQDGEEFPLGPYQARVFAIPGHTPGSAAFAIGPNLFLGDSADAGWNGRIKGAPWIFNQSSAQNRASLANLARRLAGDAGIRTLVFGHSAPLARGVAALEEFAAQSGAGPLKAL
jgi:glyoxylase-like metal-dependent hydrolase (beta-lactamase superfamily II)